MFGFDSKEFWYVQLHEKKFLQKKKTKSQAIWLLLLRWFETHAKFFDSVEQLPEDLFDKEHKLSTTISREILADFIEQEKRLFKRYQMEVLLYLGFNKFDSKNKKFQQFLIDNVFKSKNKAVLQSDIQKYLKKTKVEIPDESTLLVSVKRAKNEKEQLIFSRIDSLLSKPDKAYIDDHILSSNDFDGVCQFLRQDSGSSSRKGIEEEIERLKVLNRLPIDKFNFLDEINSKQRNDYRRRFFTDTPHRIKQRPDVTRYSLAIMFFYQRHQEAIDNLGDHLIHYIHKIKKIEIKKKRELNFEIGQQLDSFSLLYKIAEINRDNPKSVIEEAVYPSIPKDTIDKIIRTRDYAKERKKEIRESVINTYSINYRTILFRILDCFDLHSDNKLFLQAVSVVKQFRESKLRYYPADQKVPLENLVSKQLQKHITQRNKNGDLQVLRKNYECAIFKLLRSKLKHKEVWISGAYKYRNPVDDHPKDFDERREEYFSLMGMPLSAKEFVAPLKQKMAENLKVFDEGILNNKLVEITQKKGKPWIKLTPLAKVEEPQSIMLMKKAILNKWGMIDLLDILKEVDLRENFTNCFKTAGNREILEKEAIRKRLLLSTFAIGTNTGFKRTAGATRGAVTFEELRHMRKYFINKDDLREAISQVINSIFKMRNPKIWRSVSTACAADSKQFGCFSRNLMTEWSPRHHNSGVMIYWHVNDQYLCVHSQLKTCTSSEVASMLQGVLDQETDMEIRSQYVDSHGASELGFALSHLEGFDLLPRYKTIGKQKLYLPCDDFQVNNIQKITTRSINWKVIEDQYEEMIKHAVALRLGTATAETLVRKFARSNYQHPTFRAFMELGKVIKTIFMCRYLHSVELRQQINAGLNIVENWNGANDFIFYGKGGEISSNVGDNQEISMLCLHLLQTCVIYVNTMLVEDLIKDDYWQNQFNKDDYRALTALFYLHINPYGTFELDLTKRLLIDQMMVGVTA